MIVCVRTPSQDELGPVIWHVIDREEISLDDDDLVTSQFDGKKRVKLLQVTCSAG
jgi:hypothetical protein